MIWSDGPRWRAYLRFNALFCLLFFPIYFGGDYLAGRLRQPVGLYFDWERDIPFVPWMVLPYLSLFSLYLLPLLHLEPAGMARLSRQSSFMLVVAACIFVALPTRSGFAAGQSAGLLQPVFDLIVTVDATHNLVPSLHVAFSAAILLACAARAARRLALFYGVWLAVIAASTVLTHRHHILDVVAGAGLALAARAAFPVDAVIAREPDAEPSR